MFTVTRGPDQMHADRHLSGAVYAAITASEDQPGDVVLAGESGGVRVRAVYRSGKRVLFECRDADDARRSP